MRILFAAALTLGVVATACSGSGGGNSHGATPCCGATGSVQQPPPFAPSTLFAQAYIVVPATCPLTLATLDLNPLLTGLEQAGDSSTVDPVSLHYLVTISDGAVGKQAAIVITDDSGVRGIGPIGEAIGVSSGVISIAPIQLLPQGGTGVQVFGQSNVESAALCDLGRKNLTGPLLGTDVQALVSSSIAATFTPSAANGSFLLNRILDYSDALAGIEAAGSAAQVAGFDALRTDVESSINACASGLTGKCANSPLTFELERDQAYAAPPSSYGIDPWGTGATQAAWRYHFLTMIQRESDRLGDFTAGAGGDPVRFALTQTTQFRRYAIAAQTNETIFANVPLGPTTPILVDLFTAQPPASGTVPSLQSIELNLLLSLEAADTQDLWLQAWNTYGSQTAQNLDLQLFDPAGTSHPITDVFNQSISLAATTQQALTATSTYDETFQQLITGAAGGGELQNIQAIIFQNPQLGSLPAVQRDAIADIVLFSSAAATFVPQGGPAPDTTTLP